MATKQNPISLGTDSLFKGGGNASFQGTQQAIQAFLQTIGQSSQRMMQTLQKMQEESVMMNEQARQAGGAGFTQAANQLMGQMEQRRQEKREDQKTAEAREFGLESQEYMMQLQKEMSSEQARVQQKVEQQYDGMRRYMKEWERQRQVIPQTNTAVREQIMELTKNGYWDKIPDGPQLRLRMLKDLRTSEALNETHYSAPYLDRAIATYNQAVDDTLAGRDPMDLTGFSPDPLVAKLPGTMVSQEDLPDFTEDELRGMRNRQGYPAAGALHDDDPAKAYANPFTYQSAMLAMMDEHAMADFTMQKSRQKYIEDRARMFLEADKSFRKMEEAEVGFEKIYQPLARDAIYSGINDVVHGLDNLQGESLEDALTNSILANVFKQTPDLANLATSLMDPVNPEELDGPGEWYRATALRSGAFATLSYLQNTMADPEVSQDLAFIVEDMEAKYPGAVQSLTRGSAGDKAVALRRVLWRLTGNVESRLQNLIDTVDQQSPVRSMREELGATTRGLDSLWTMYQSTKDEGVRTQLRDQIGQTIEASAGTLTPEQMGAANTEGGQGFWRSVGAIESMGILFNKYPNKMAGLIDFVSGGEGGLKSPNIQAYEQTVKMMTPKSPALQRRLARDQQNHQFLMKRGQQPQQEQQPQQPQQMGGSQNYGAAGSVAGGLSAAASGIGGAAKAGAGMIGKGLDAAGNALTPVAETLIGEQGLDAMAQPHPADRPEFANQQIGNPKFQPFPGMGGQ